MEFPKNHIAGVIPPSLPPGSLDRTIPQSAVDMPRERPSVAIVTRGSEHGARYVFERSMSLNDLYTRLLSDDREHMLNAALRMADRTLYNDKQGYFLTSILPKAHIANYKTGDTKEEFKIFYK